VSDIAQYIVLNHIPGGTMTIQFYSAGIVDLFGLGVNRGTIPIFNRDIFKLLAEYAPTPSVPSSSLFGPRDKGHGTLPRGFKDTVRESLRVGSAVSVELGLGTGWQAGPRGKGKMVEERFVSHWTPLKDEAGRVKWVVLVIAPK
jgi:hypothetical protein